MYSSRSTSMRFCLLSNPTINDRLARQRADVVVKALIEQYEIAADRISYDSKGDREQPFAENDKNRVSIMIAE